jgi:hypothetical protein
MSRIGTLAAVLLVSCFAAASACEFGAKSGEIYESLGLKDAQVAQLEELRNGIKKVRAETAAASEELRKKIDVELLKAKPSTKVVDGLVAQQGQLRQKVSKARADALLKAKKIVDEKQFSALVEKHWGCRCAEPVEILKD